MAVLAEKFPQAAGKTRNIGKNSPGRPAAGAGMAARKEET
jgi:hypothetical protein